MGSKYETKVVNYLSQMLIIRYLTDHGCDPGIVKQVEETFGITDKVLRKFEDTQINVITVIRQLICYY